MSVIRVLPLLLCPRNYTNRWLAVEIPLSYSLRLRTIDVQYRPSAQRVSSSLLGDCFMVAQRRIGILAGGGDCADLNAVIRSEPYADAANWAA